MTNETKYYIVSDHFSGGHRIYLCNKKDKLFTYHKEKAKTYKNPKPVIDILFISKIHHSTTIHISTGYPPKIWTSGLYEAMRADFKEVIVT
jgi:hypothetical protein